MLCSFALYFHDLFSLAPKSPIEIVLRYLFYQLLRLFINPLFSRSCHSLNVTSFLFCSSFSDLSNNQFENLPPDVFDDLKNLAEV